MAAGTLAIRVPNTDLPGSRRSHKLITQRSVGRLPSGPPPTQIESGTSRRPPGKGGPSGIARGETAQVLTVASSRSADQSRATAMGPEARPRPLTPADWATMPDTGRVLAGATGRNG